MVGPITASANPLAIDRMSAVSLGVKSGFGFWGVAPCGHALITVAEPRLAAIPAEGASELPSVAGAGLVGAGHISETMISVSLVPVSP